ncbi:hypothetical protein Tco_1057056 [Tanacetum coccineum]|uniref:Retrotransposon gag domain-containing protein n=1 Tax=Tanacetum coccineum TaxID=301880 RepID=A0ABQ5H526_9ASTR
MKRLFVGSITTCKLFKQAFLDEYRPPLKIIKQIESIRNFKQKLNEPLHCSWERFTESLFSCPEHKLNEHEQLRIFYQGLEAETRLKVDFKGPIPQMTPTKEMEAIQELSAHSLSCINIPVFEALEQMPKYAKFMKDLLARKGKTKETSKITINERCSVVLLNKIPFKEKDPRSFTIPCVIGKMGIDKPLADLGANISLMPYYMYARLDLGELKPTRMCIELANKSTQYPRGIAENVIVKIDKFIFLVDFVVLDMKEDHKISIILGRRFLAITHAMIDVFNKKISFEVGNETIMFDIEKSMKFSTPEDDECLSIDIVDKVDSNLVHEILPSSPLD